MPEPAGGEGCRTDGLPVLMAPGDGLEAEGWLAIGSGFYRLNRIRSYTPVAAFGAIAFTNSEFYPTCQIYFQKKVLRPIFIVMPGRWWRCSELINANSSSPRMTRIHSN
jgi:hypothetical protein